jgi:acyltransferase
MKKKVKHEGSGHVPLGRTAGNTASPPDTKGSPPEKERLFFVDTARFYGIALVFYGHFIMTMATQGNSSAASYFKFIYSFHMPLFFVLAGFVSRESDIRKGFGAFLKEKFLSRILPLVFFNLINVPLSLFLEGTYDFGIVLPGAQGYAAALSITLMGFPVLNALTWFLLCLFSTEIVHYVFFRFLRSDALILLAAPIFYAAGYFLNYKYPHLKAYYFNEALVAYAFYLTGIFLRNRRFITGLIPMPFLCAGTLVSFLLLLFTYRLNTGPFLSLYPFNVVIMEFFQHGDMLLFPLTALAGSLFILLLARLTPANRLFSTLGQKTMALFGLDGIFHHFVNARLAPWCIYYLDQTPVIAFFTGVVVTLASLALCLPFVFLLDRYIPQLVGKPKINGPIFRNFI